MAKELRDCTPQDLDDYLALGLSRRTPQELDHLMAQAETPRQRAIVRFARKLRTERLRDAATLRREGTAK